MGVRLVLDPEGPRPPRGAPLTARDESFGHQLVAPAAAVLHAEPSWAERCFHLLHAEDGTLVCAGRQLYPVAGRRYAFASVSRDGRQHVRRVEAPFTVGEDPDSPAVGPITIEATVPLEQVAITYAEAGASFAIDLSYAARWPPEVTDPLLVEQDGRPVTHYQNFFQSGVYDGTVEAAGSQLAVRGRAGFRDRGWGLRKHDGAPRRGLVLNCTCELDDRALYMVLFETAAGRRVLTSGWVMGADPEDVTAVEHDLRVDDLGLLHGGRLRFVTASGRAYDVRFDVVNRLFYSEIGYTADASRRAPGSGELDLADDETVARVVGQTANAAVFTVDGRPGHGYVETGIGTHVRYRPDV